MKKTCKRQLILFAVIAVMMVFTFVMTASAEESFPCPGMSSGTHSSRYVEDKVVPPTCTQRGYTTKYCTYCKTDVVDAFNFTDSTGHNYSVSYVYDEASGTYTRVRECQNDEWLCQRDGIDPESGLIYEEKIETDIVEEGGYYLVNYANSWESLDINDAGHKAAHLTGYYEADNDSTWVLNYTYDETEEKPSKEGFYRELIYSTGKKETADGSKASPATEYVIQDGGLKLFAKADAELPAYDGDIPVRNRDLTNGAYEFTGWQEAGVSEGKINFKATFEPVTVTVSGVYYDHNGLMLSRGKTVGYGETVNYGDLVTPTRKNDQQYKYTLTGWSFDRSADEYDDIFDIKEDITLYFDTSIYAVYSKEVNSYEIIFAKHPKAENAFTVNGKELGSTVITYGSAFADHITGIPVEEYSVPADKEFLYVRNDKAWVLKAVNGNKLNSEIEINPHKLSLPQSAFVTDKESGLNVSVDFSDGDKLTVVPKYDKHYVTYKFTVKIKPVYFLAEDYYIIDEGGQTVVKSELMDDFIIQVTDENGQYIASGKTDRNGTYTFTSPYKPTMNIVASMSNLKYSASHKLDLSACETSEDVHRIADNGLDILPRITDDWLEGLRGCNCICHSIFSPIVIRIYNLLYNLFGTRYVCCNDLFIVHGDVLAYSNVK